MTNKKIIIATLLITIIHFLLTSVIGHYIAVQIGAQMGQVIATGIINATGNNDKSEDKINEIYQDMKKRSEDIEADWKIPLMLISLPAKPLINPFLKNFRQKRIEKVFSGDISQKQFYTQGILIDHTANFLNSVFLGLLVYLMLIIFKQYKKKT